MFTCVKALFVVIILYMGAPEAAESAREAADESSGYTLIKGQTADGRKFRPSDWCDRLIGSIAVYAREESELLEQINDSVCLTDRDGFKGIVMDNKLRKIEPMLYRFLQSFADDNNLTVEQLDDGEWNSDNRRVITQPKRAFV